MHHSLSPAAAAAAGKLRCPPGVTEVCVFLGHMVCVLPHQCRTQSVRLLFAVMPRPLPGCTSLSSCLFLLTEVDTPGH